MATISLTQILDLVGKLDDSPGSDTPRERFRHFLEENITEVGQLRDYIEECLRTPGDHYYRPLQDLVNRLGTFLGFQVTYGRYQGVQGQIGFDGHWQSPSTGFHIVAEVKATEAYAIKTSALLGYVDGLISDKQIPSWESALGLYVVCRPDPHIKQLENSIVAEKRTHQLRVISVESLLGLAEMMAAYGVGHEDVLAVMQPSGPSIDSLVDLMQRLVTGAKEEDEEEAEIANLAPTLVIAEPAPSKDVQSAYWLTPVKSVKDETAEECIQNLVGKHRMYAYSDRTPGRKKLKPGDWLCFYANGKGVVAHARVASVPRNEPHQAVRFSEKYPWTFDLDSTKLYLDDPVPIDASKRAELDAFRGKDTKSHWAWFVQGTKGITEHDFGCLTRS